MKKYSTEELKEILDAHKAWLEGRGGRRAVLRSADLSSAVLRSADLSYAVLRSADLRSADLRSADLSYAVLRSADLSSADLRSAVLRSAVLRSADFSSADLRSAVLCSADLRSADLRSADLSYAVLSYADLRSAAGDFKLTEAPLAASIRRIIDPYDFYGWRTNRGNYIKAGCNFLTCDEYRAHVAKSYPGTLKAAETLRIIDFIEAAFAVTP